MSTRSRRQPCGMKNPKRTPPLYAPARVVTCLHNAQQRGDSHAAVCDCTGATDYANHVAALIMITMQGGVFWDARHQRNGTGSVRRHAVTHRGIDDWVI